MGKQRRQHNEQFKLEVVLEAAKGLRTVNEIAQAQTAPLVTDIRDLAVDFWPDDETADDINQFVARQCQSDREREA